MKNLSWSRRDFLKSTGWSSLSGVASRFAWISGSSEPAQQPRFAYVSSMGDSKGGSKDEGIHVFAVERGRWRKIQSISSERPAFLALHPSQQSLYVVNEIDSYRHLPTGSVESFAIDPRSGHLSLLNRQPLSLSATSPRHLAIAADGSSLVVASHGGGAYNLLPLAPNGALERVSSIVKETGSSLHQEHQTASHPQMVLFDSTGRMLSADLGSDRLSVFSVAGGRLASNHRSSSRAGAGPRQIALQPDGQRLFVAHGLEASISCYRYDTASGQIGDTLAHTQISQNQIPVAMAMHPSGRFLYTSHSEGVAAWRINASTGDLTPIHTMRESLRGVHAMMASPEGSSLILTAREQNSILRLELDPVDGRIRSAASVAKLPAPASVAMKYV